MENACRVLRLLVTRIAGHIAAYLLFMITFMHGSPALAGVTLTIVDSVGNVGDWSSMRLNASGFPVISYYNITNLDLKIAICNNAACTAPALVTLDTAGNLLQSSSLALTASGFPVVSYHDVIVQGMRLATCGDPLCSTVTLSVADSLGGYFSSLQLNASGFPVISHFRSGVPQDLAVVVCGDATCTTTTTTVLDSPGTVGQYSSLQLNASGFPVISYYDSTNADLKLAVCGDAVCSTSTLTVVDGSTSSVGQSTFLQLNASGFPVITYWNSTGNNLKLAVCGDAACTTSTITALDSGVGRSSSFRLNANGFPIISYFDQTNLNLKLAVCNDAVCSAPVITTLDSAGDVGRNSSLQLNASGFPVISYYDLTNGDLKLATLSAATVASVSVPANANYTTGQNLDFTVNWTDPVTVTGSPMLPLTIGATARNATYLSGSGTNALVFRYTVQAADNDNDGITVGAALSLNGGTINWAGFPATLTLNSVGVTTGVQVNFSHTVTPSAGANGSITPNTAQLVATGGTIGFTVTPNAGYSASVGGTCGGNLIGNVYTTNAVNANCTVVASFAFISVTTFVGPSATGTGNISASFTGGGAGCTFMPTPQYIPVSGHPRSPPAGTAPPGIVFPQGLFDFTTTGCTAASTITMTVTYPNPLAAGTQYWKYGPTPTDPVPHWYVLPATIVGNTATFSITDGQLGDDDLVANGTIVDQGGPGAGAGGGGGSIPTLSEWAMMLLALAMMAFAARRRSS